MPCPPIAIGPRCQLVTAMSFGSWLAQRAADNMAPRTMNHYHTRLRSFLVWCVDQHWIAVNPITNLKRAKIGQKGRRRLRRAYSVDEWTRLIAATHGLPHRQLERTAPKGIEATRKARLHPDRRESNLAPTPRDRQGRPRRQDPDATRMRGDSVADLGERPDADEPPFQAHLAHVGSAQ